MLAETPASTEFAAVAFHESTHAFTLADCATRPALANPMARILLVDDEPSIRALFGEVLALEQHEVTTAGDGNAALAALAHGTFDLVVTDIVMPDKEGIEFIRETLQLRPDLPIIAMSGGGRGSSADYLTLASLLGARMTLAKPFSARELLDAVARVMQGPGAVRPMA